MERSRRASTRACQEGVDWRVLGLGEGPGGRAFRSQSRRSIGGRQKLGKLSPPFDRLKPFFQQLPFLTRRREGVGDRQRDEV